MVHKGASSTPKLPQATPITRSMPLSAYLNTINPGSAGKSATQLRQEALAKTGFDMGASGT